MRVLNLLTGGEIGGIERLCRDIGLYSGFENGFCFMFYGGMIYEQMKREKMKVYCLEGCGKRISYKKYKRLLDIAEAYDIITVHHGDPFLKLYFWLLHKKLKKRYVTYVHSCYERAYFYSDHKGRMALAHRMYQMGLDCSDKVIFVSEAGRKSYLSEFRLDTEKTTVVYNGVGLDKLIKGRDFHLKKKYPYHLIYIGRLTKVKGIDLLLKAAAVLKEHYPIIVSIVGDGDSRAELEALSKELRLESIVRFWGQQQDVTPFLKQAGIFIYPSVWQEIFGISIVEAMAFGIPCVANAVGGIPEIIRDKDCGYLNYYLTAESLADTIKNVINDYENESIERRSQRAKERAWDFSIVNTTSRLHDVYREIMKGI